MNHYIKPYESISSEKEHGEDRNSSLRKFISDGRFDGDLLSKSYKKLDKSLIYDIVQKLPIEISSVRILTHLFKHFKIKVLIAFEPFCERFYNRSSMPEEIKKTWHLFLS